MKVRLFPKTVNWNPAKKMYLKEACDINYHCYHYLYCIFIHCWQKTFWKIETKKLIKATIMLIKFWDFLMVEQIFLSPQVKQSVIISTKLVLTSCLKSCRTLETSQDCCLMLSPLRRKKTLPAIPSRSALPPSPMKTRAYLKYSVNDCS